MGVMASTREPVFKTGDLAEGRYRILQTLGEGGMGSVYLAEHALIRRRVAIKVLHPELATDPSVVERFMNEARAAGTLGHPNIVESTDMGFTSNHVPYIVFEYLEGSLLTDEVYRVGGLPVGRTIHIARQIASALAAAHNAGVVHRDLKSDNVFLTDKDDALDHVKVLDFGISRFLEIEDERSRGLVMGTPEFMAPEQITSPESVDRRADIYALGVIMYEMVMARRPFTDDDPRALMQRIVDEPPPPLDDTKLPPELAQLILTRMLAKDPAARLQSMVEVEQALEAVLTEAEIPHRNSRPASVPSMRAVRSAETPWPPPQRATVRPRAPQRAWPMYAVAGVGFAVGVAGVIFGLTAHRQAPAAFALPAAEPPPAVVTPTVAAAPVSHVEISLGADAADAHVTFRRRVAPAPITMEVGRSDVVELVEVAAAGRKTVRYWLTFDRPTHLVAHLVKGSGFVEATDQETLVALGEVAPSPKAPELTASKRSEPTRVASAKRAPRKAAAVAPKPDGPAADPQVAHAGTDSGSEPAPAAVPAAVEAAPTPTTPPTVDPAADLP